MEPVIEKIAAAARISSSVVITGESGTGKELVARALHQTGPRRNSPFIALNCAAIPDALIESELFGYVRGAFTDARENKSGLFVRANGGTIFLDEIADASLMTQAKLLRVLQEREVLPLGAVSPIRLDVRWIAATHKSLVSEIAASRFRQDLFYRLRVIPIHVPPLRERSLDILFLTEFFASRLASELQIEFYGISPDAILRLKNYAWPGNARELQNRVEHALALSDEPGWITPEGLFPEEGLIVNRQTQIEASPVNCREIPSFGEAKSHFERTYLERVLHAARGNITRAARLAEKSRTEIYALLRKHRLDPLRFKLTRKSSARCGVEAGDPLLRDEQAEFKSHA